MGKKTEERIEKIDMFGQSGADQDWMISELRTARGALKEITRLVHEGPPRACHYEMGELASAALEDRS